MGDAAGYYRSNERDSRRSAEDQDRSGPSLRDNLGATGPVLEPDSGQMCPSALAGSSVSTLSQRARKDEAPGGVVVRTGEGLSVLYIGN